MSTAVMLSVCPERCENILSGQELVEIRKTRPKMETPFKCYIYCTKAKCMTARNGIPGYADELCRVNIGEIKYGYIDPLDWPAPTLNGKVIAEFTCYSIESFGVPYPAFRGQMRQDIIEKSGLDYWALHHYAYNSTLYAWHIYDLTLYDKPKKITDFRKPCENDLFCESCGMYSNHPNACGNAALYLKRPPQSWCYVEEVEE